MVLVPGGEFLMGDPWSEGYTSERPVHAVWIDSYYIDRYEVTNQEYADALNWAWSQGGMIEVIDGEVRKAGDSELYCYDTTASGGASRITWDGSTFGVVSGMEDHSMQYVTWYGAVAFCNWQSAMEGRTPCYDLANWTCNFDANGYRLPTEAEWEKAAAWDPIEQRHYRFGEHTDGCGSACLDGHRANYGGSGDPFEEGTTPVGYYDGTDHAGTYQTQDAQSYYGCRDMSGNVWEWCNDWLDWDYYTYSPYENPIGPATGNQRILRGGTWRNLPGGVANARSARRYYLPPDWPFVPDPGFRCAIGVP